MNRMILPENTEKIDLARLVPMDLYAGDFPVRVQLDYATPHSLCGLIYREQARLWLYDDLAAIVLRAAQLCHARTGLHFILYDGLRTMEAQGLMQQSPAVQAHPEWLEGPNRVLSPPGLGGHPRAMAIDIGLEDADGALVDMGTLFDEMPMGGSGPDTNRAHRLYPGLPEAVRHNRSILEAAMVEAAAQLGLSLLPLPVEWWDFRFPADVYNRYAPLSDADLPVQMRMTDCSAPVSIPDFDDAHFEKQKDRVLARVVL